MENLQQMGSPMRSLHDKFAALTEPIRPALWRYCLRLTGSAWDAEDLVQETMIRAFGRLRHYFQPLDAKSYLFRIATNAWIDSQRRARLHTTDLDAVGELAEQGPAQDPAERWAAMEALVTLLPPRQRVVVLLADVFNFTAGEVAAMIGSTEGAVKAALHRARTTLRERAGEASTGSQRPDQLAAVPTPLVQAFLDAFNRQDPDGIAALLRADATSDIVGVAEELGRDEIRENSLRETFEDPRVMRAIPFVFEGEPVVGIFHEPLPDTRSLLWIIRLEEADGLIIRIRVYCFTPELNALAAELLGCSANDNGYRHIR